MIVSIPAQIRIDFDNIVKVWIEIEKPVVNFPGIPSMPTRYSDFILDEITVTKESKLIDITQYLVDYKNYSDEYLLNRIKFKVLYKNDNILYYLAKLPKKTIKNILLNKKQVQKIKKKDIINIFENNNNIMQKEKNEFDKNLISTKKCIKYNYSVLFEDSDNGRSNCLTELFQKASQVESASCINDSNKNLLYYSVYGDGYANLLNESILSIIKNDHNQIDFDILLITDEKTKNLILKKPFYSKIQCDFLITETPTDGIEASKNKTRIFEYEKIFNYNKILFLDCDIICLKDKNIKLIFDSEIEHNKLYSASNIKITQNRQFDRHISFHHGFQFLGEEYIEEMKLAGQIPFNAGQFLFRVSDKMHEHFKNLRWFMANWPGEYFFEQSFMNYYFCKSKISDVSFLNKYINLMSTLYEKITNIDKDVLLIHFTAPPLEPQVKLDFIKNYFK